MKAIDKNQSKLENFGKQASKQASKVNLVHLIPHV